MFKSSIFRTLLAAFLFVCSFASATQADIIITVTGVVTSFPNHTNLVGQPVTIIADLVPSIFVPISPAACASDLCYQAQAESIDSTTISVGGDTLHLPDIRSFPFVALSQPIGDGFGTMQAGFGPTDEVGTAVTNTVLSATVFPIPDPFKTACQPPGASKLPDRQRAKRARSISPNSSVSRP
jgi:hypothetical protein